MEKFFWRSFSGYMGHLVRAVVLIGAAVIAYFWMTSGVPGGEKRYEQWIRQAKDRHVAGGI
jgi:hypothetical protein